MVNSVIALSVPQLALGYIFIIVILFILKKRQISREKELILATFRMTFQLVVVGLLLTVVIDNPHPLITLLIVSIMVGFAVFTVFRKFKGRLSTALKKVIAVSLPVGALSSLMYFLFAVIGVEPYFNPQYVIPITGMIVGNSMTGVSLGVHTMMNRFTDNKEALETALHLGAAPKTASKHIINESFDAAIMPTLNNMLGMGIIFLPGMMTGQILSGVVPTTAIMYQIGVMLGILGGVAFSTFLSLRWGYKTFFNAQDQLR